VLASAANSGGLYGTLAAWFSVISESGHNFSGNRGMPVENIMMIDSESRATHWQCTQWQAGHWQITMMPRSLSSRWPPTGREMPDGAQAAQAGFASHGAPSESYAAILIHSRAKLETARPSAAAVVKLHRRSANLNIAS
jgi:hypothetical protein